MVKAWDLDSQATVYQHGARVQSPHSPPTSLLIMGLSWCWLRALHPISRGFDPLQLHNLRDTNITLCR